MKFLVCFWLVALYSVCAQNPITDGLDPTLVEEISPFISLDAETIAEKPKIFHTHINGNPARNKRAAIAGLLSTFYDWATIQNSSQPQEHKRPHSKPQVLQVSRRAPYAEAKLDNSGKGHSRLSGDLSGDTRVNYLEGNHLRMGEKEAEVFDDELMAIDRERHVGASEGGQTQIQTNRPGELHLSRPSPLVLNDNDRNDGVNKPGVVHSQREPTIDRRPSTYSFVGRIGGPSHTFFNKNRQETNRRNSPHDNENNLKPTPTLSTNPKLDYETQPNTRNQNSGNSDGFTSRQNTNLHTTNRQSTNLHTTNRQSTNLLTNNRQSTNFHTNNRHSTNLLTNNRQSTNLQTNNRQSTNFHTNNRQGTNLLTGNMQSTNLLTNRQHSSLPTHNRQRINLHTNNRQSTALYTNRRQNTHTQTARQNTQHYVNNRHSINAHQNYRQSSNSHPNNRQNTNIHTNNRHNSNSHYSTTRQNHNRSTSSRTTNNYANNHRTRPLHSSGTGSRTAASREVRHGSLSRRSQHEVRLGSNTASVNTNHYRRYSGR